MTSINVSSVLRMGDGESVGAMVVSGLSVTSSEVVGGRVVIFLSLDISFEITFNGSLMMCVGLVVSDVTVVEVGICSVELGSFKMSSWSTDGGVAKWIVPNVVAEVVLSLATACEELSIVFVSLLATCSFPSIRMDRPATEVALSLLTNCLDHSLGL